jgi:hypothetical protein
MLKGEERKVSRDRHGFKEEGRGRACVRSELLRSGRVEDLEHALLSIDFDLLTVRVFDCGVVLESRES